MRNNKFNISLLSGLTRIFTPTSEKTNILISPGKRKWTNPCCAYLLNLSFQVQKFLRGKRLHVVDGLKRNRHFLELFSYSGSLRYVSNPLSLPTGRGSFRRQGIQGGHLVQDFITTLVNLFLNIYMGLLAPACYWRYVLLKRDTNLPRHPYGKLWQLGVAHSFTDVVYVKHDWMLKIKSPHYFLMKLLDVFLSVCLMFFNIFTASAESFTVKREKVLLSAEVWGSRPFQRY